MTLWFLWDLEDPAMWQTLNFKKILKQRTEISKKKLKALQVNQGDLGVQEARQLRWHPVI